MNSSTNFRRIGGEGEGGEKEEDSHTPFPKTRFGVDFVWHSELGYMHTYIVLCQTLISFQKICCYDFILIEQI